MSSSRLHVYTLTEVFLWMKSFSLHFVARMDFLFQLLLKVINRGSPSLSFI